MENSNSAVVTQFPATGIGEQQLEFSMRATSHPGTVILHCNGRLIYREEARALSRTVGRILPTSRRMVIDLAGITAVDSAGLGELVMLHIWSQRSGYLLKFASPTRELMDLFALTNLTTVFDLHASVADAVAS
jgi:anti-sigma B factor antagonist